MKQNHAGDKGKTSIRGQTGISKADLRIEALGSLDEVQSWLGLVRAVSKDGEIAGLCLQIQQFNQLAMSELAEVPDAIKVKPRIEADCLKFLDENIQAIGEKVQLPKKFIFPGETTNGAILDGLRTVVRRAERHLVRLHDQGGIQNDQILAFYNRLSTLCFYLEVLAEQRPGQSSFK